jgi:hypothetical protein
MLGRQRMAGSHQSADVTFVHLAMQVARAQARDQPPATFVFVADPDHFDIRSPRTLVELHRLPFAPGQVLMVDARKVDPARPQLSAVPDDWVAAPEAVVLMPATLDQTLRDAVAKPLGARNRAVCDIKNEADQTRLVLWHTPEQAWLCGSR